MIPILILAAGRSTRMRGTDKLLEDVDGAPLLRRQVDMAIATGAPVFVAIADKTHQALLDDTQAHVLVVPEAAEGIGGTLRGAVSQLPQAPAFMVVLADLVAITTVDLQNLITAYHTHRDARIWRAATPDGKPGHPVIFESSLRAAFADLHGDSGANALITQHAKGTFLLSLSDSRARLDLDTPEDWAAWRASQP